MSDEPLIEHEIKDCTFATLKNKNKRIQIALETIETNYFEANSVIQGNGLVFNDEEFPNKIKTATTINTPNTCRNEGYLFYILKIKMILLFIYLLHKASKKGDCFQCRAKCNYTLRDIMNPHQPISQPDLLKELFAHSHPKSKKMPNGKFRTTPEGRVELSEHYKYAHSNE